MKRPILVGGVGLATGLWLLDSISAASTQSADSFGFTATLALGAGVWWLSSRSKDSDALQVINPPTITRSQVEKAIAQAQITLDQLGAELKPEDLKLIPAGAFPKLHALLAKLGSELDRQELRLGVVGGQGVGKTSLLEAIAHTWKPTTVEKLQLLDTPQLFTQEALAKVSAAADSEDWRIPQTLLEADAVLFMTAGDLTETELRCIAWIKERVPRLYVVLNKQDQRLPQEQAALLSQVRSHLKDLVDAGDVVAIAAQPSSLTVIQPQGDGSRQQQQTQPEADLTLLLDRLNQLLVAEPTQPLVWKTLEYQAKRLEAEAKALLNTLRQKKSMKIVEQYQWVSAGAAFINPLPSLDLLAAAAVNSQLIVDLSKVYQQPLSVEHAKVMATTMAEMLIKLGVVEVSTQLLGTVLKTHGVTYLAGGAIQGASAAYLTRVVGLSLTEYFQQLAVTGAIPEEQSLEQLRQILQKTFQASRQTNVLQAFATQAVQRFKPEKIAIERSPS